MYDGGCSIMIDSDDETGACWDISAISSNSVRTLGDSFCVLPPLTRRLNVDKQSSMHLMHCPIGLSCCLQREPHTIIVIITAENTPKIVLVQHDYWYWK
jgi:hypothetical protein